MIEKFILINYKFIFRLSPFSNPLLSNEKDHKIKKEDSIVCDEQIDHEEVNHQIEMQRKREIHHLEEEKGFEEIDVLQEEQDFEEIDDFEEVDEFLIKERDEFLEVEQDFQEMDEIEAEEQDLEEEDFDEEDEFIHEEKDFEEIDEFEMSDSSNDDESRRGGFHFTILFRAFLKNYANDILSNIFFQSLMVIVILSSFYLFTNFIYPIS